MPAYVNGKAIEIPPNTAVAFSLNKKTGEYEITCIRTYEKDGVVEIPTSEGRHFFREIGEAEAKWIENLKNASEISKEKPKRTCSSCTIC